MEESLHGLKLPSPLPLQIFLKIFSDGFKMSVCLIYLFQGSGSGYIFSETGGQGKKCWELKIWGQPKFWVFQVLHKIDPNAEDIVRIWVFFKEGHQKNFSFFEIFANLLA